MENKEVHAKKEVIEKLLHPKSGYAMLFITLLFTFAGLAAVIAGGVILENGGSNAFVALLIVGIVFALFTPLLLCGLKVVGPNEAIVLLLFGKYKGSVKKAGFFWVNPFMRRATVGFGKPKVSLKALTHNNEKQKVNDADGNPIEIGVVIIWRIINTAKALFMVENFGSFVSIQSDSVIRHVARMYPYDVSSEGDEKSLRASSQEVADMLKAELQARVDVAGVEILDARISHLAYAPEIAQVMLQRQQANAIIAARQKIVDGAVSMVEMAVNKIKEKKIAEFDAASKAQMVSNLLVILCGNKDAQPIINSSM
ncbi:MAG: SPFH domain-containing protein [Firmicutes bacterium]|nr:SPFH domain-containing protein [Bacillota bacterium]